MFLLVMVYVVGSSVEMWLMCSMAFLASCAEWGIICSLVVFLVCVLGMGVEKRKERRSGLLIKNKIPSEVLISLMYL